jgi:hypothetical protein
MSSLNRFENIYSGTDVYGKYQFLDFSVGLNKKSRDCDVDDIPDN